MSVNEIQAKVKARAWQTIAQNKIDVSDIPQEKLEELINVVSAAAMAEMDDQLTDSITALKSQPKLLDDDDEIEDILWEGRPYLSISKRYIITDDRVRIIDGILGRSYQDIELIRIQDVEQSQSLSERMLNVGDITIHSHDRSHPIYILNNVSNPAEVHEILRRAVLKARKKHNFSYRQEM